MFDQFKAIMQNGERYVVVENGRPEYVLMNFADYVAMVATGRKGDNPGHNRASGDTGGWEKVNAELKEVESPREENDFRVELAGMPTTQAPDPATIRLEDLPL